MTVQLQHVVKEFREAGGRLVRAVDDVSLEVAAGEMVTLLGPSGCGKTTTLRMIAGFELPSSGAISIGGKDLTHVEAHERDAPMVFQSYALFPHLSVRENAMFGLRMRRVERTRARREVEELAGVMGLGELLERSPHQLSGGQQQRVALLRALMTAPKLLLFDEPLSNLDARLRVEMREEIRRIVKRSGITAIYVTHDREEAMALSDRVVVMERGKIAQVGTSREVYEKPASRFVATFFGEASFIERGADTLVVRPESVTLVAVEKPGALRAKVLATTYLGSDTQYRLQLEGGAVLTARVTGTTHALLREGESTGVELASALHQLQR